MNFRIISLPLLSIALSACSSVGQNKAALGDFDYATKVESKALVIPENLDKPNTKKDFFVTDNINHNGPVGKNLDIRAPSLVLPIAASSRVVNDSDEAIIWFDKVIEEKDLLTFLEQALISKLSSDNVSYTVIKEQEEISEGEGRKPSRISIYESDWYHDKVEAGSWISGVEASLTSMRFRYELFSKGHGRSVSVKVKLIEYMKTDRNGVSKTANPIDTQRAEIAELNQVTSEVDFLYRKKHSELRKASSTQKLVTTGENTSNEPAYIVDMNLDNLWSNMPLFFEKYGFTVTDLNESDFIYYVDFVKPNISLWDKIWGDEAPVIEINNAAYQFVLAPVAGDDNKTSVTIYKPNGEPLTSDVLDKIFPVIEAGLSFRSVY